MLLLQDGTHKMLTTSSEGKYQWIEKSYGDDDDDEQDDSKAAGPSKAKDEKVPDSTLGPELQHLVKLIFNQSSVNFSLLRRH